MPRLQRTDAFTHRMDVVGRRAAAAADYLCTSLGEVARIRREVLGAGHVDLPPLDLPRHAGVRLRAELPCRHRRHLLDALEDDLRPDRAIEPDDVGAPF